MQENKQNQPDPTRLAEDIYTNASYLKNRPLYIKVVRRILRSLQESKKLIPTRELYLWVIETRHLTRIRTTTLYFSK